MSRWPDTWSCEEIDRHVETYLDGELPELVIAEFRSHLDSCPACAAQVHLANEIQNELHSFPELDTPAPVLERVLDQTVRAPGRNRRWLGVLDLWPRPVWAAVAAAGLVAALGLGIFNQRAASPVEPDPATVARAADEARYALAKAGLLTRKAGQTIRDRALRDQIVAPTTRGLSQVLGSSTPGPSKASSEGVSDV